MSTEAGGFAVIGSQQPSLLFLLSAYLHEQRSQGKMMTVLATNIENDLGSTQFHLV